MQHELESQGFVSVSNAVDQVQRTRLLRLLGEARLPRASRHPSGIVFAARHLLTTIPELSSQLCVSGIDALAAQFLGAHAFPIDAAYFDKQPGANWTVPVHQDRILPVFLDQPRKHRVKDGIVVAEPSQATLARLLALRVHFDPTDRETGALAVLPGSHAVGVLGPEAVRAQPLGAFVPCAAAAGDVLLMRPLLLHRSPPSKRAGQRRVLHVVYATEQPDDGLRWLRP